MQKTLYELLGVASSAQAELLDEAFRLHHRRLEPLAESGDQSARNDLVALRDAYRVLSSPERRRQYDQTLQQSAVASVVQPVRIYDSKPDTFIQWWDGPKTSWLLLGVVFVGALWAGQRYFVSSSDNAVRSKQVTEAAAAARLRSANEAKLVEGLVENQAAEIANRAQIDNQSLNIVGDLRESLAAQTDRVLDMAGREQELRLRLAEEEAARRKEFDRERAARSQARQEERVAREESMRIEREKRYYSCLNGATGTHGYSRAQVMCLHYK